MKLKYFFTALVFFVSLSVGLTKAEENINIYFFWGDGCPHCAKEEEFLKILTAEDRSITVKDYEVWNSAENREFMRKAGEKIGVEVNGVPFTIIGEKHVIGYLNDKTTGVVIEQLIDECKTNGCKDVIAELEIAKPTEEPVIKEEQSEQKPPLIISGFDLNNLSLPLLTVVLGFLDGFNPCAMWTLLFLISLLLGMENKKRMWALGIAFIITSALVYFLFMVAWLKLFLFIGFIFWVRALIGVVALVGGYYSLKKFIEKKTDGCDVVDADKKKNVFDKLGKITSNKSFILALIGIVGLAFAVNLVELICSAGLPAIYTQVLALNNMAGVQYYLYILAYILFFMLDDLIVFFIAMITLQMTGITTKYVRYSRLIGGVLMLLIGLLLIFKPELLMMG